MNLVVLPGTFAVCRFSPESAVPAWAWKNKAFLSVTYTPEELSIVCPDEQVPADVQAERNWAAMQVRGPLDFSLTGIMARLTSPLAAGGVSIFAISTYDTDYLLVKQTDLPQARKLLEEAGNVFEK